MSARQDLIARKHDIRRQIEQTQRELARLREPAADKPNRRRIRKLETRLDALMAQEYALRVAIDRAG